MVWSEINDVNGSQPKFLQLCVVLEKGLQEKIQNYKICSWYALLLQGNDHKNTLGLVTELFSNYEIDILYSSKHYFNLDLTRTLLEVTQN